MATVDQVWEGLRQVVDPELGINVVDLGLVYGVNVQDGRAHVVMTMTTPTCPLNAYLSEAAESAIRQHARDVTAVAIEVVWEPPWDPAMMSAAAKRQLGWKS